MQARVGDWIVVESLHLGERRRRGRILGVDDPGGEPPYLVRWTDDDHESLFFPGPEAHVEHEPSLPQGG